MGDSPEKHNRLKDRWRRDLPWLGSGKNPFWLSGGRSNWTSLVFYVGTAGLTRTTFHTVGLANPWVVGVAYLACSLMAGAAAKLTAERIRFSKICTAILGFVAFTAAPTLPALAPQPVTSHATLTLTILPLLPGVGLLLISGASELLCHLYPADKE
ncbi:hypothetical protein ACQPYH_06220 [Kribbella sp. CA-245084]|uniref:hypothetical protein n=1 Tax=Kribbella sp. CA-245084 TaxID=3239940 RepID=UPI003D8E6715